MRVCLGLESVLQIDAYVDRWNRNLENDLWVWSGGGLQGQLGTEQKTTTLRLENGGWGGGEEGESPTKKALEILSGWFIDLLGMFSTTLKLLPCVGYCTPKVFLSLVESCGPACM